MLEGGPVLTLEDVLRHDVDADVVFVGGMKKKNRGDGIMKFEHHGVGSVAVASSSACCTSTPHFTLGPKSRSVLKV